MTNEIRAASLQFVRKITGFNKPSKANEAPFLNAIDEIADISLGFFTPSKPRHRRRIEKKKRLRRKLAPQKDSACDPNWSLMSARPPALFFVDARRDTVNSIT